MRTRLTGLLLVVFLSLTGCYNDRWVEQPRSLLGEWQPEGLRQARAGAIQADAGQPAIRHPPISHQPPSGVEIELKTGEVVRLREPYVIGEAEPGVFRVMDEQTPVRSVRLEEVARVRARQRDLDPVKTATITTLVLIPITCMALLFFFARGPD